MSAASTLASRAIARIVAPPCPRSAKSFCAARIMSCRVMVEPGRRPVRRASPSGLCGLRSPSSVTFSASGRAVGPRQPRPVVRAHWSRQAKRSSGWTARNLSLGQAEPTWPGSHASLLTDGPEAGAVRSISCRRRLRARRDGTSLPAEASAQVSGALEGGSGRRGAQRSQVRVPQVVGVLLDDRHDIAHGLERLGFLVLVNVAL
jgi:hypothetical protein